MKLPPKPPIPRNTKIVEIHESMVDVLSKEEEEKELEKDSEFKDYVHKFRLSIGHCPYCNGDLQLGYCPKCDELFLGKRKI